MIKTQKAKVILAGILLSTSLGLTVWVNTAITSDSELADDSGRIPASSGLMNNLVRDSRGGMAEFASLAAESGDRSLASLGHPADQIDTLRFGLLEGKYALSLAEGKVQSATFVDTPNSEGSPVRIKNRSQFLQDYSEALNVTDLRLASAKSDGRMIQEEYVSGRSRVKFILDERERLLGLTVEQ